MRLPAAVLLVAVVLGAPVSRADDRPDRGVLFGVGVGAEHSWFDEEARKVVGNDPIAIPLLSFFAGYRINAAWAIELVRLQEVLELRGLWQHEVTALQAEYSPTDRLRTAMGGGLAHYTYHEQTDHSSSGFEVHGSIGAYLARGRRGGVRLSVTLAHARYDDGRSLIALVSLDGLLKLPFPSDSQ